MKVLDAEKKNQFYSINAIIFEGKLLMIFLFHEVVGSEMEQASFR